MKDLLQTILKNKKPLLMAILAILGVCWLLGNSFLNLIHNKLEFNRLSKLSQQLDQEYENLLQRQHLLLKQDPVLLEKIARVQYHMSAPQEVEFRFTNQKK